MLDTLEAVAVLLEKNQSDLGISIQVQIDEEGGQADVSAESRTERDS